MRPSVNVHIDQLILDGFTFTEAEQAQLQAALTAELARLLAISSVAEDLIQRRKMGRLDADAISSATPNRPAQLGRQIARSVHDGLQR
jgi:hypothetical protein